MTKVPPDAKNTRLTRMPGAEFVLLIIARWRWPCPLLAQSGHP